MGVTNEDIFEALGGLKEAFRGVEQRLDRADESRKVLYDKLDAQSGEMSRMAMASKVTADVAAAAHRQVETHRKEMDEAIKEINDKLTPVLEQWGKVTTLGKAIIFLLSLGGVSLFAMIVWFGGVVTEAIRHWLGIPS